MTWINFTKDWTGHQALAVVEFLDELSAAIWKIHEPKMLDAWHQRFESDNQSGQDEEMTPDPDDVYTQNPSSNNDDFPF